MKTDSVVFAGLGQSAASSAKRRPSSVIVFRSRFALKEKSPLCSVYPLQLTSLRASLEMRSSVLVWSFMPAVDEPKERFNSVVKKIPKRVGASTQPLLSLLLIPN